MNEDKLSRIMALRPAAESARRPLIAPSNERTDRLLGLLGAECRSNPLGQHIALRRQFPGPQACEIGARALRLLAPHSAEDIGDPRRWLFLDTETTGLAGGTGTYAFLVGVAWWNESGLVIEQFFMRNHSEEASLLLQLSRIFAERRVLVTFNGKSFDWPLLETRFRMTRAGVIESPLAHLDLLHPSRQLWRFRLKSVALAELERHVLDLDRGCDIPAETIPRRYFDFLRGGPPEPVAEIFHHNQMDLRGLAMLAVRIAKILEEPESHECEATELYGISRLLQRRGEKLLAGKICERALAGGLTDAAGRAAKRQIAFQAKRQGDLNRANGLWQELLGDSAEGLEAYEQLAIYHEHQTLDLQSAVRLTRAALVTLREALHSNRITPNQYRRRHASFQHRLNRLIARTEC